MCLLVAVFMLDGALFGPDFSFGMYKFFILSAKLVDLFGGATAGKVGKGRKLEI